jgi:hypothetical protein
VQAAPGCGSSKPGCAWLFTAGLAPSRPAL